MDIFAKIFQLISNVATGIAVFFFLNRDSRLRLLERENKRYRFWKDFYETQGSLPAEARFSPDELGALSRKCKRDLDRSFAIVMEHARLAEATGRWAGCISVLALFTVVEIQTGFFSSLFSVGQRAGFAKGSWQPVAISWFMQITVFCVLYVFPYRPARNGVRNWMLDLQRKQAGRKQPLTVRDSFHLWVRKHILD